MRKSKDDDLYEQPDIDPQPDVDEQPDIDNYSADEVDPSIGHHPDLTDGHNRYDYIAVDGQTLVAEFKFSDGSGIKAWTRDQGAAYATRHITQRGHAVLLSGQARVDVEAVNAEIERLASEKEPADD